MTALVRRPTVRRYFARVLVVEPNGAAGAQLFDGRRIRISRSEIKHSGIALNPGDAVECSVAAECGCLHGYDLARF